MVAVTASIGSAAIVRSALTQACRKPGGSRTSLPESANRQRATTQTPQGLDASHNGELFAEGRLRNVNPASLVVASHGFQFPSQYADASHPLALLRARCERPRGHAVREFTNFLNEGERSRKLPNRKLRSIR
jgi:hypothetical protein